MKCWVGVVLWAGCLFSPVSSFSLGCARLGPSGARLSVLRCATSDVDPSVVFADKLAKDLKLLPETADILKEERFSEEFLSTFTQEDLERIFLIGAKDASRIRFWCQSKAREEEAEAKRKAREDEDNDEYEDEVEDEDVEEEAKSVTIYDSARKRWMDHVFVGQRDLTSLLDKRQSTGLVDIESLSPSFPATRHPFAVTHLGYLVNGTRYCHIIPKRKLDEFSNKLHNDDCVKVDFNTANLLTKQFGVEIINRATCVVLSDASTDDTLGHIDTLFSNRNGSIVVLLEIKASMSNDSIQFLFYQLEETKAAFNLCATRGDPVLTRLLGIHSINLHETRVYSAVYCKAGPDEAFGRLKNMGFLVIKDGKDGFDLLVSDPFASPIPDPVN